MSRLYIALLVVSSLVGCNQSARKKYRVAVVPKGTSHQFWKSVHAGAEKAAKELGDVEVLWKGPLTETDTAGQIDVVKNFVTKHVSGICLAPSHSESLVDVVQEASAADIPTVIFDSGIGKGAEIVSYVATDNYKGGALAARRMGELLDKKGGVILLRYRAGSESTEQREAGFLDTLQKEFPDIKVLSSDQYGEATTNSAMEKAQQLLQRFQDDVQGVFAVCEPNCNGMLEALEQTGMAGKVKFVAFDPSDGLIRGLKAGKVHGIVLQDPVNMGYMAVKTVVAHLKGEKVEPVISTGQYVATAENMETERFQTLLNPIQAE